MPPAKRPARGATVEQGQAQVQAAANAAAEVAEAWERPRGLYNRLLWVMAQLPHIPKTGKMEQGQKYDFVEETVVMQLVRPLFIRAGIAMVFSEVECTQLERTTRNGPANDLTRKVVDYTFINADDPTDRFTTRVHTIAQDNLDKGPGKALTAAGKMAVLKVLMVPTGDELEVATDAEPTEAVQRQQRQQPQQRSQPSQAARQQPQQGTTQAGPPQDSPEGSKAQAQPEASLESLAKARALASDALLPPSVRKEALALLDSGQRIPQGYIDKMIARLQELVDSASEDDGTEGEREPGQEG
jgi:hypothetical protein